jgi:hypothetical protein
MLETILVTLTALGLTIGVITEVVEPAAQYGWDKAKAGYEYVEDKINPDA